MNKDYEQKKRECYEEFKKEICFDSIHNRYYFDKVFDRAYTLGKQEKNEEEIVISGWVARDKNGNTFLYKHKPNRIYNNESQQWGGELVYDSPLPYELFPDFTWYDDPIEVEIIIKRKKNEYLTTKNE